MILSIGYRVNSKKATLFRQWAPSALTAVNVLVAESDPSHKDKIVKLILNLIMKGK